MVSFDIRVVDTDAKSNRHHTTLAVLKHEKKRKYSLACRDRRTIFIPLCVSTDFILGCKAAAFLKWVADLLSTKWDKAYGSVMG